MLSSQENMALNSHSYQISIGRLSKVMALLSRVLGVLRGTFPANRVVIIVDGEGVIQYRWEAENPGVEPDYDEVLEFASSM